MKFRTHGAAIGAFIIAASIGAMPALAEEETRIALPTEEMTEKTQALGLSVGNTYACATDDAARALIEEEAHLIFDLILKDVGSALAWSFATGAGYGASVEQAEMDCDALAESWQEIRADFGIEDVE
ncbi:MAG: hypothetical protein AAFU72_07635 [Pseudomonadota bacterium]